MIVVSAERDGLLWTTALVGEPGFIRTLGPGRFDIEAELPAQDPLFGAFDAPREIGMIAIEPETRRRMRINGTASVHGDGLRVHAEQVYSNCPKYIQTRHATPLEQPPVTTRSTGTRLTENQRAWVGSADTFFIGTSAQGLGADASHRGGNPGFVGVEATRLSWPDYLGNSMYMTFGNLELDSRASLLFIDFEHGHTLHLNGTAKVDWDDARASGWPGAQRMADLEIDHVVQLDHRLALRWELEHLSKFNPPIRPWSS